MDDIYRLFFDPEENVFLDECGFIIFDIFSVLNPNIVYLFKLKKEYMFTYGLDGGRIELFYMKEEDLL
jgi:hypothetical protein